MPGDYQLLPHQLEIFQAWSQAIKARTIQKPDILVVPDKEDEKKQIVSVHSKSTMRFQYGNIVVPSSMLPAYREAMMRMWTLERPLASPLTVFSSRNQNDTDGIWTELQTYRLEQLQSENDRLTQTNLALETAITSRRNELLDLTRKLHIGTETVQLEKTRREKEERLTELSNKLNLVGDINDLRQRRDVIARDFDILQKEHQQLDEKVSNRKWTALNQAITRLSSTSHQLAINTSTHPWMYYHVEDRSTKEQVWTVHGCTKADCKNVDCFIVCDQPSSKVLTQLKEDGVSSLLWRHPTTGVSYMFSHNLTLQTNLESKMERRIEVRAVAKLTTILRKKPHLQSMDPLQLVNSLHPKPMLTSLARDSAEFQFVQDVFCLSSSTNGKRNMLSCHPYLRIINIEQVSNVKAARIYRMAHFNMVKKSQHIGFHGTAKTNPYLVARRGLDPCFGSKTSLLGQAMYIAQDALYSHNDRFCHITENGERILLMVWALVGNQKQIHDVESKHRSQDELEDMWRNLDESFDSLGGVMEGSRISAVRNQCNVIVTHVIRYRV